MLHVKKFFGKALLINIRLFSYSYDYHLNELEFFELAKSGDMSVVASFVYKLNRTYLNPKYLIGQSKLYNPH